MIIGFSGTRMGMTKVQKKSFLDIITGDGDLYPTTFIHGGAEGSDEQAHDIVETNFENCCIEIYPTYHRARYWEENTQYKIVHPPKPPLVRNEIIAQRCELLIAISATEGEVLRSGTWSTVRYARKHKKKIFIIYPSGHVMYEDSCE